MSTQAATDFFDKVYADPNLRQQLQGAVGDVNHTDLAADRSYGNTVAQLGQQNGFNFTADEGKDAYKLFVGRFTGNNQGQDADLSDAELEAVTGGLASAKGSSGSTCCKTC